MNLKILVFPGDGIGTEVTREAVRVLRHVAEKLEPHSWNSPKDCWAASPFTNRQPASRRNGAPGEEADATLMGAVGLPEFDNAPPEKRPESGLLGLRKALGVFANLRPVRTYPR